MINGVMFCIGIALAIAEYFFILLNVENDEDGYGFLVVVIFMRILSTMLVVYPILCEFEILR